MKYKITLNGKTYEVEVEGICTGSRRCPRTRCRSCRCTRCRTGTRCCARARCCCSR